MTELPEICCCGHGIRRHEPHGLCAGCVCCEYVGAGSPEAMTMLAMRKVLKDSKINVDVKVEE